MDENLKVKDTFLSGVFWNNPTLVLVLGMCPALGVTNTVQGSVATGLATLFVLVFSNFIISLLRKIIPDKVRIPAYIVIISTFVTVVQMVMRKFLPDLYSSIGAFIALIVVNCLVLGRADGFASSNKVWISVVDGFAMGLGFTLGLFLISFVREFLTAGTFWGLTIIPNAPQISGTAGIVVGFIVLACYIAAFRVIMEKLNFRKKKKLEDAKLVKTEEIVEVLSNGQSIQPMQTENTANVNMQNAVPVGTNADIATINTTPNTVVNINNETNVTNVVNTQNAVSMANSGNSVQAMQNTEQNHNGQVNTQKQGEEANTAENKINKGEN